MNSEEIEQITEIQKDSENFETVLDVFRTLLKWSDDLEKNKDGNDGRCHHQPDFVGSTK